MFRNYLFFIFVSSFLFFLKDTNATVKLLQEYTRHSRVWLSAYDQRGLPINTTTNTLVTEHADRLSVEFMLYGRVLLLQLVLNRALFAGQYKEPNMHGTFQKADTNNCYYLGEVYTKKVSDEAKVLIQDSQAAVSTCDGLRGWVWLDGRSLHIEPEGANLIGWHYVVDDAHAKKPANREYQTHATNLKFGPEHRKRLKDKLRVQRSRRSVQWPYDHDSQSLIIELFVVNDHAQFEKQGSDEQKVIQRTKQTVNIVNSLYRQLNIYVALVGLEVWSEVDKIQNASSTEKNLDKFLEYRARFINYAVHNDNAQLISGKHFDAEYGEGVAGRASIMTMCSWSYSGGINMDDSEAVGRLALTMAHEMGHNLGMTHDSTSPGCPDDACIMSSHITQTIPTHWSEDSKEQLKDAIHLHIDSCLHNLPAQLNGGPSCGNGFVDQGEDCDCGLLQDCSSKCCDAATCTFKKGAVCATGSCCNFDTCQLRPAYHECRASRHVCDLPEFCDGVNEMCPSDVFKHNGHSCLVAKKQAYCYEGECRSHDSQCRLLWGSSGRQAHESCFTSFNILGKISGNCGSHFTEHSSPLFVSCNASDVMCGLLHCEHQNEKLMFWKETVTNQMLENKIGNNKIECKGVVYDMGVHTEHPGMVPSGAMCGKNKVCVAQHCRNLEEYVAELGCPDCHGHGVCNTLGQCHCDSGYAPPDCAHYGGGGSIHSKAAHSSHTNLGRDIGISVVVLVLLAGIVFILVQLLRRRNYILKEFSLSNLKPSETPKNDYYKQQQLLRQQQQPLQRLPSGFVASSSSNDEPATSSLLYKPPPKMPLPQIPPSNLSIPQPVPSTTSHQLPPPRRPPKMKLSSVSFSNSRKMFDNGTVGSASTDLGTALQALNDIEFAEERPQPFRKAPPPPPQSTNLPYPTASKRHRIVDPNAKADTDTNDKQNTLPHLTPKVPSDQSSTIPSSNPNRRSKVLSKPSYKPPPPPKPKI